uniref:Transmembrane protein 143 n=1 Tax=Arion vulgaris TaxID=1028688 RepID=A0A0B6XXX1_9EUPU
MTSMMASSLILIRRTSGTTLCPLIFKSHFTATTGRWKLKPDKYFVKELEPLHYTRTYQANASRFLSISASHKAESSPVTAVSSTSSSLHTTPTANQQDGLGDNTTGDPLFRERYIPVSRQSIIRHFVEEKDFLTEEEKKLVPGFVRSLDTVLVNKYHGILEELKALFDPINPDKDTQKSREWTRKEKLDNEFWLLQKLEDVMIKANFHELPKNKVDHFLKDHEAEGRVQVSVDPSRYDILRFWVLGHDIPQLKMSLSEKIISKVFRRAPAKPKEYFKRVVVALRLKKDSKLMLKAFKEIPVQNLEKLLPDGTIRMRAIDRALLASSAGIACFGVLAKMVTVLASLQVDWTLVLTLVSGTLGFRLWSTYRNRRNAYLLDVSRTLYFKNIANNRGLLTLLVDRAEDESLKEVLLTYVFLLNTPSVRKIQGLFTKSQTGGLTSKELETTVEKWLEKTTSIKIIFDSTEAIKLLQTLGLVVEQDNKYHSLQLDIASRLLPQSPSSVITRRAAEIDTTLGCNKDEYLETDAGYKSEDLKRQRQYGWF